MGIFNPAVRILLRTIATLFRIGAKEKVVMFHSGRTGSTVVTSMLHKHPKVYWAGEVLGNHNLAGIDFISFDYKRYLELEEFSSPRRFYGMEIKFADLEKFNLEISNFVSHLEEAGYHYFILLWRKNQLRRIISKVAARETGLYHQRNKSPSRIYQVFLDTSNLIADIDHANSQVLNLRSYLKDKYHLEITYESDIESTPEEAYQKICRFLELRPRHTSPGLHRINPYPISELLINYAEVMAVLKGSPYEWMLYN